MALVGDISNLFIPFYISDGIVIKHNIVGIKNASISLRSDQFNYWSICRSVSKLV